MAFIKTDIVFNEFAMTKVIDADVKKVEQSKKLVLDSIIDMIKKVEAGIIKMDVKQVEYTKKEYVYKNNLFTDEINSMKQSNIDKIWQQINQYVMDYSKENNYSIVFGANGQGSLMYAEEGIDITKEMVIYINNKYNDKK